MSAACTRCDRPVPRERAGGSLCAECADSSAAEMRRIFGQVQDSPKCHDCGRENAPVLRGVVLCAECAAARREAGK